MISAQDFRKNRIRVYGSDGELIQEYEGGIYLYFDKEDPYQNIVHFITEDNKHHRICRGNCTVIIDEM